MSYRNLCGYYRDFIILFIHWECMHSVRTQSWHKLVNKVKHVTSLAVLQITEIHSMATGGMLKRVGCRKGVASLCWRRFTVDWGLVARITMKLRVGEDESKRKLMKKNDISVSTTSSCHPNLLLPAVVHKTSSYFPPPSPSLFSYPFLHPTREMNNRYSALPSVASVRWIQPQVSEMLSRLLLNLFGILVTNTSDNNSFFVMTRRLVWMIAVKNKHGGTVRLVLRAVNGTRPFYLQANYGKNTRISFLKAFVFCLVFSLMR